MNAQQEEKFEGLLNLLIGEVQEIGRKQDALDARMAALEQHHRGTYSLSRSAYDMVAGLSRHLGKPVEQQLPGKQEPDEQPVAAAADDRQ